MAKALDTDTLRALSAQLNLELIGKDERYRGFGPVYDVAYVIHERAHFVMLYGRPPKVREDYRLVEKALDRMTPGRSQLHELRVIALQKHVQPSLGIPFDLKESIDGAWFGLEDVLLVDWSKNPLKSLVTSKSHARHLILSYKPSMRKIRALRASLVASIALARKQKPRGISYQ